MAYGFYLYGILLRSDFKNIRLQGLDDQPVKTQVIDDFVLLYSEAQQERYLASRRNLLGHEKVLEAVMENGHPTLLPLQFGLTAENWESVKADLIKPYEEGLKKLLKKLEGNREVSIKVFWNVNDELQLILADNESLRNQRDRLEGKQLSMDEVISIGQRIEQAIADHRQQIIEVFERALIPLAIDWVENDLLTESMIYNAAYLIPWDGESLFSQKVDQVDQELGGRLRIRYNNFTAPFNFANLDQLESED